MKEIKDGGKAIEKLFNFRPVFFSAVFLCLGISLCFAYYFYDVSALWFLVLIPIAATPFFFCRTLEKGLQTALAVVILGVFFFVGFFSFLAQLEHFYDRAAWLGEGYASGRVVEKRLHEENVGLVLDDLVLGGERVNGRLVAYLPTSYYETVELSDEIFVQGTVSETNVNADNFSLQAGQVSDGVRFYI